MKVSSDHLRSRIFLILFALLVIVFGTSIYLLGWYKSFAPFTGMKPLEPYFADLRHVAAAVDAQDQGLNPWLENPGDPWHRVTTYPAIWVSLFRFIAQWGDPVLIFGVAQLAALLGLGLCLSRQKEGYLACLLLVSQPIMLAIERGNSDIAVFLLMFAGVWLAEIVGGVALGLAAALKYFPAVAIVSVVALGANYRFLVGVALTLPFIVWSFMQLPTLSPLFWSDPYYMFGIKSSASLLYILEAALVGPQRIPRGASSIYIVYAIFFVLVFIVWFIFRTKYEKLLQEISNLGPLYHRIALSFLATFVGIFLTASNFSYRLLFLTPVLWVLSKVIHLGGNRTALILLILGLIVFFLPLFPYWGTVINIAVFTYAILVTPILIEACVDAAPRRRQDSDGF